MGELHYTQKYTFLLDKDFKIRYNLHNEIFVVKTYKYKEGENIMKKFLSLLIASAVSISTVTAFAAPNRFGIETESDVTVDITVGINNGSGTYKSYPDETDPMVSAVSKDTLTGKVNAKATLDMTNVAQMWNEYIDKALEEVSGDDVRDIILDNTELTGEFTITVTADSAITNAAGADVALGWNDTTLKLFKQVGTTSYTEGGTTKYVIKMEIKATNDEFDKYFTNANRDKLTLEIRGSEAYGVDEVYEIAGDFEGYVNIDIPGDDNDMKVNFTGDAVNYVKQKVRTSSGTGGVSTRPTQTPEATDEPTGTPEPTGAPEPTERPAVQLQGTSNGATLNYVDHYAYIIGYDEEEVAGDGTVTTKSVVRPENNITRAEVATIFYRLLSEESRTRFRTEFASFTDVANDAWYAPTVATVAAAGIVNGYDDGTFRPDNKITRAEFAAIASRFTSLVHEGESLFNDIAGHWAEQSINNAAITGWVNGYDDGSYRPENYITRAEAITLINRVLYRYIEEDDLHHEMITWEDNTPDKWYYTAIQEATNSHDYDREHIGEYEVMTSVNQAPDWESHEN